MNTEIRTAAAPAAIGPYSQAIKAGSTIYVSGQLPIDPATGEFAGKDIASQTRQSLTNMKNILAEAGTDMSAVVKTTVLLADIADFAAMNAVYAEFFAAPYPARAAFQVACPGTHWWRSSAWLCSRRIIRRIIKRIMMKSVCSFLRKCEIFYVATTDRDRPHLRPFGAAKIYDGRLYIQTGGAKAVASQLRSNPNVEIVACDGENWMRISATVDITTDENAKVSMLEDYPYLQAAYDESNPMLLLALTDATVIWNPAEGDPTVTKF